ncbi:MULTISPECIES: hypothetical protein [unclassified Sulfitobacter]|uniref:nitroreductase family protein n=1 Tax=unclassified Sulfitobacter TaxID=196795 RepID=UPI0037457AE2
MILQTLKAMKGYIERVAFVFFKLRQTIRYSLSISNQRNSEHKLREIAHSIDKAQKLPDFDERRVSSRIEAINAILVSNPTLSDHNRVFLKRLGLIPTEGPPAFQTAIGLPSIRHFSNQEVPSEVVESSVLLANLYPKSCSRESVRIVHFEKTKREAAGCFSGLTAFGEGNYELFAVVGDLSAYDQRSEIFAPYIDGAIFATAMCDALWRSGIGTCMLNWSSQSKAQERRLRNLAKLGDTDIVVMGIAAGHPAEVPFHAPRKSLAQTLTRF